MMQTRDQKYAAKIFKQITDEVKREAKPYQESYGSMAHKLPVLIRSAGLAQAIAFVESRGKDPHKKLLDHLAQTILENNSNRHTLSEQSRAAQLAAYAWLTHEAVAALEWYKRFAQSVLDVDASEGDELSDLGQDSEAARAAHETGGGR